MTARLYGIVLVIVLFQSAVLGQEWNYPAPDPGSSSADISFYEAPDGQALAKIAAGRPQRIILCIGDGMGFNHIALARQRAVGSIGLLHMERLPVFGVVRTHSASSPVTDSAAAGTAIACGVKTNNGMIGMSPDMQPQPSILTLLDKKGWRTGLVATSTISHATPAAFAAHVASRSTEAEIAAQMFDSGVDVLFGGGLVHWTGRKDGRDLIAEARQQGRQVIFSREQMQGLTAGPVVGLFAAEAMTTFDPEPSLACMTRKTVELLSAKSPEWFAPSPRFFLMVEGSQIDWAGHNNDTDNMVRQLLLFDMAVKEAIEFAARDRRTLVIVTSDHETGGLMVTSEARWTSKGHTAADVPLFAYGPGAERFGGALDNTGLFLRLADLTGLAMRDKAERGTARQSRRN